MTSPRARPVLLAFLCILAIALAAATLNSAVAVDGNFGFGSGGDVGYQPNESAGSDDSSTPSDDVAGGQVLPPIPSLCVPFLATSQFQLVATALLLAGGFLLYRWKGPLLPIGVAAAIGPVLVLAYLLLTACVDRETSRDPSLIPGATNVSEAPSSGGGGLIGGGTSGSLSAPSLLLLGVLGAALIGAVALYLATSDDREIEGREEEEAITEPAPEVIGRIAGQAADRIEEDAALENEVFRAWHEMTTYLDVANPESSSPGEFADAAVAAGMDRDDVTRLTRLFEEIRYGTAEPTSERERRAVNALRRIEETYSEDAP